MTGDRFQQAKRIYALAQEQPPAERDAYLEKACGHDDDLRREVESLLGCREDAQAFFQNAAIDVFSHRPAAWAAVPEPEVDYTGRTLSHYDLLEKIGEGGMGVVYRARDTRLDRLVAVKVLPPEKVADPERLRRFVQEAKAASALNHPNIVTIHDIDSADGITFIVMEHVKGTTLDQLIRHGPVPPKDTLAHAFQIADALSAAHGAGIVHRDVKPANIMVTDSGLVKILDFGLAKLNAVPAVQISATPARLAGRTEDGLIVGTVAYMSPEQAEGRNVDARSDIFSLGAVLYEMATGCRAFAGERHAPTLAAVVGEQPRAVRELAAGVPAELELIITRCLEKDRERRFQRASDVKAALEGLLRQGQDAGVAGAAGRVASARRRRLAWIAGALLSATLGGLAAWRSGARPPAQELDPKVSALTVLPGSQVEPSLSPDGTRVAFVWDGDIHVQRVGDTTPQRLTDTPDQEHSPAWSPDAGRLAFLRVTPAGNEIVIVPTLSPGGAERRLLATNSSGGSGLNDGGRACRTAVAKLFCGVAWSPDGRFLAVVDRESPQAPSSVFLVDVDTGERRRLTRPPAGFDDGLSAFSPDGRTLAFSRRSGWPLSDIYLLRLDGRGQPAGDPVRLTHDNAFIWGFDWAPDGRSLVFSSSRGGVDALWRVASSGGRPAALAVGGNNAFNPSIARRGNRLAFSYGRINMHLWRVPTPGVGRAQDPPPPPSRISHSPQWDQQPAVSPDGRRVAWASTHSGSHQIWTSGSGGEAPTQLSFLEAPGADMPRWSPDGRLVAFRGFVPGPRPDLYLVSAEGGAVRRLTTGAHGVSAAAWSSDGHWIYFSSDRGDGPSIWRVQEDGGGEALVSHGGRAPVASRDGKWVYYGGLDGGVWKAPADGAGPPLLLARRGSAPLVESADAGSVYFRGGDGGVWRVPATGGEPEPVARAGPRAAWTLSNAGLHVLDPDATNGPALEFAAFDGTRVGSVRLPGEPDDYVEPLPGTAVSLAASPDGSWVICLRRDPAERKLMLVDNFR